MRRSVVDRVAVVAVGRGRRRPGTTTAADVGSEPGRAGRASTAASSTRSTRRALAGANDTLRNDSILPVPVSVTVRLKSRRVGRVADVVVDRRRRASSPTRPATRRRASSWRAAAAERDRRGVVRLRLVDADDDRRRAAVAEEVLDGVAEAALEPEPAEDPLELGEGVIAIASSTGPRSARPTNAVIDVATPVIGRTPLGTSSM